MARRPLRRLTAPRAPTTARVPAGAALLLAVVPLLAALLLAVVTLLAACSAPDGGAPGTPSPAASTPVTPTDRVTPGPAGAASAVPGTPDAAALATITAWLSYDTRVDARPNDTARRLALPWLAPDLRREVLAVSGDAAPGAAWARWTAHRARARVAARLGGDDHPPDTADTAWRQVEATVTLTGDGGWSSRFRQTSFVQLVRISGRWLVAAVQTSQGEAATLPT